MSSCVKFYQPIIQHALGTEIVIQTDLAFFSSKDISDLLDSEKLHQMIFVGKWRHPWWRTENYLIFEVDICLVKFSKYQQKKKKNPDLKHVFVMRRLEKSFRSII